MNDVSAAPKMSGRWIFLLAAALIACTPPGLVPPPMTGPLPPNVNPDADGFRRDVQSLVPSHPTSHTRERAGICPHACTVPVEIVLLSAPVPDPDDPPSTGAPLARIRNLHPSIREGRYGFDPSTDADYYLWIDSIPNANKTRWTLLRVPVGSGTVTAGHPNILVGCHPGPRPSVPDVDFVSYKHPGGSPCFVAGNPTAPAVTRASVFTAGPIRAIAARIAAVISPPFDLSPIWIECNSGCCT